LFGSINAIWVEIKPELLQLKVPVDEGRLLLVVFS